MAGKNQTTTFITQPQDEDASLNLNLTSKINNRIATITDIALDAMEQVLTCTDPKEKRVAAESWLDRIGFTRKVEKPINSSGSSGNPSDAAIMSAIKASIEGVASVLGVTKKASPVINIETEDPNIQTIQKVEERLLSEVIDNLK